MNTQITRQGYVIRKSILSKNQLNTIRTQLTVCPANNDYSCLSKEASFCLFTENEHQIIVPKYFGIEMLGDPQINELDSYPYPKQKMKYVGCLRENQQLIVQKVFECFKTKRGGVIVAGCGSGKTNMAIYVACKYRLKTLFVVHLEFLRNQIMERIKQVTNVQRVGIIQKSTVQTDSPFIVGMVHSLVKRDYQPDLLKDVGLIVIDEVHHMGARCFAKMYQKYGAKYMLGISAEKHRLDKMYKIIHLYMGPLIHVQNQPPNNQVIVKKFHYRTSNKDRMQMIYSHYGEIVNHPAMINNVVKIKRRNRFLLHLLLQLHQMNKHVLMLSERVTLVHLLHKLLTKHLTTDKIGKYIGGMKETDLAQSAGCPILLATYQMAQEGLDIPHLNAVILATPKSNVKQSIGRILRKEIYTERPLVIDIADVDNVVFNRKSSTRNSYYRTQKYVIQNFNVADYDENDCFLWNDISSIERCLTNNEETTDTEPDYSEMRCLD